MPDDDTSQLPHLGNDERDRSASILRAVVGVVPIGGSALAEIVTSIIPNQRLDRIERYLLLLARQLEERSADLEALKRDPEAIAVIEDGAFQAARAVTDERLRRIVSCVVDGITESDAEALRGRQLLEILSQLNDKELAILVAYDQGSWQAFDHLRPPPNVIGADPKVSEANALWEVSLEKLERFGLIVFMQKTEKVGSFTAYPIFDVFGKRSGHRSISSFGRVFLQVVGLARTKDMSEA
ncbi:hypothetical protein [Rhizobium wuzhouense]|uniref:Uncharacterized protein n=1 Tax=Rhizobium wuzhouense TaxID=1986026 RepID=A0ABX5NXS1_9HYPH|nr:hypothetical protein [Rhizobium wuzhouense]PYB77676.1 hypothetical protein DMY87_04835 [Rhizobium wuzhouense]